MMQLSVFKKVNQWHNVMAIMLWINQLTFCQEIERDHSASDIFDDTNEGCPSLVNTVCPCLPWEEGLHIECASTDVKTIHNLISKINRTVYSFSIYDLDKSVQVLTKDLFLQADLNKSVVIKKLHITLSHIKDIDDGFVELVQRHLKEINIVTSKLSRIPEQINRLINLNQINFESNAISEVSDSAFGSLHYLDTIILKDNLISKLSENSFNGLENSLLSLDLSENKLNIFPILQLRRLGNLSNLKLALNEILSILDKQVELDNVRLISLKQLDLSSNHLKFLGKDEFRYFIKLQVLSLYQNLIESVHCDAFKSLTELTSLDLSHNNIMFLNSDIFKQNKKLKVIDLSSNHLYKLDRVFSNLTNLQELYLSDNNILEITDETFASCAGMIILNLEFNSIHEIQEDSFKSLNNLTQIYLQNNLLKVVKKNIFSNNIILDTLSLNDNSIHHIDLNSFQNVVDLRELRLNNNKLRQIKKGHFENLSNLFELYLQNNLIENVENGSFNALVKLQHMNLQNNNLKKFENAFSVQAELSLMTLQLNMNSLSTLKNNSFLSLVNLKFLYLTDNFLHEIDESIFSFLSQLEQLFLMNNHLKKIHSGTFKHLKMLVFLNISNNQLQQLKRSTFDGLNDLEELHLTRNKISFLEKNCFEELVKLKVLDLSCNPLSVINSDIFNFMHLVQLNLRNCSISSFVNNSMVNLEKLEELNLEMNKFQAEDLKLFKISNLKELKLSHNVFFHLSDNTFSNFKYLQVLRLSRCRINDISEEVFQVPNLSKLDLNENELKNLRDKLFKYSVNLKELYLNGNQLQMIPAKAFSMLRNLEVLEIDNNSLRYFSFSSIPYLQKLHRISLQKNLINEIHDSGSNSNLPFLSEINFSSNQLYFLPPSFFSNINSTVRVLNLSFNQFLNFSSLRLNSRLNLLTLNLTGNPLQLIHDVIASGKTQFSRSFKETCEDGLTEEFLTIEELNLQKTNLTIITSNDFCSYTNLLHLILSFNKIQRISPSALKRLDKLMTLDLSYNMIDFIPRERFYGLTDLRFLNVSHNWLGQLEEFPKNLKNVYTLDLSYNQIKEINENVFTNLENLNELYLYGNMISVISPDAFRPPIKLKLLDISRNNLQNLPLNALESLESQIRSLKIEENPLHCGCETQRLWEWLREHKKVSEAGNLRCSEPPELEGQALVEVSPPRLCQAPAVTKLSVQDVRPKSVLVSWQSSPHTKVYGYRVAYQSVHSADIGRILDQNTNSVRLTNLRSNTLYTICVYGLNNWETEMSAASSVLYVKSGKLDAGADQTEVDQKSSNSSDLQSMCTQVQTTFNEDNEILSMDSNRYQEGSILTRRLGLIIGSCMGFVVFIILVSILGYLKIKKQRATAKRDPPLPPEYLSYRHFSIQGAEHLTAHISHGTTTLNAQ